MPVDNAKDMLMLLLYCHGRSGGRTETICGRTRLQKLVYLLQKEGEVQTDGGATFPFIPYKYGPFSRELAVALDFLENRGFIQASRCGQETPVEDEDCQLDTEYLLPNDVEDTTCDYAESQLSLTEKGIHLSDTLYAGLTDAERVGLDRIRKQFANMPLRDLLRYVYRKYPEDAERSEIRHLVLDRR